MHQILLDSEEIAAGSSTTTDAASYGFNTVVASLYYEITGNGSIDIEWYGSLDGENFVLGSTLAEGLNLKSGPECDGKGLISVDTLPIESIKFKDAKILINCLSFIKFKQFCRFCPLRFSPLFTWRVGAAN